MPSGLLLFFLGWSSLYTLYVSAKVVPFLEPGFFFDWYEEADIPVPRLITPQCGTIKIKWSRSLAKGQNPVGPYFLQVYTSIAAAPLVIPAGGPEALRFDWAVPFGVGTQYQICMVDSRGVSGGCQDKYTVVPNPTLDSPTCQNVTFPEPMKVEATVADGGPMSFYGFPEQCSDISITPKEGKPPFIMTISPALHPPFSLTSQDMSPIKWTISMTRAMSFFVSVASSDGKIWAVGPMHVGASSNVGCMVPNMISSGRSSAIAAGSGIGGAVVGALLALAVMYGLRLLQRRNRMQVTQFSNPFADGATVESVSPQIQRSNTSITAFTNFTQITDHYPVHPDARSSTRGSESEELPPIYEAGSPNAQSAPPLPRKR